MNTTAFLMALVLSLGYYVYTVRKERAKYREEGGAERPGPEGGKQICP